MTNTEVTYREGFLNNLRLGLLHLVEPPMPTELRHLLFQPAEVLDALREYYRRLDSPLPADGVAWCGPEGAESQDGAVGFRVVFTPPAAKARVPGRLVENTQREMVVDSHVLAAALILYCRDRRIPLPAIATKSLQRFGSQVCLIATIRAKSDKPPSPN